MAARLPYVRPSSQVFRTSDGPSQTTSPVVEVRGPVGHKEVIGVGMRPKSYVIDDRDGDCGQIGGIFPCLHDVQSIGYNGYQS